MASSFPGQVSAAQVGSYFLNQYYSFLQKNPNLVHQFYTETSTMIRCNGAITESATGTGEIHSLVINLNFTVIEIKTAHSLDSLGGGVLVMVKGLVQANDFICRRKFVETFFLAPQEKGFFVLNDIFLLLEDEPVVQHLATEPLIHDEYDANVDAINLPQEPVSCYELEEDTPDPTKDLPPTPNPPQEFNPPDDVSLSEELSGESYNVPDSDEIPEETPEDASSSLFSNAPLSSFSNAPLSSFSNALNLVEDPLHSEEPVPVVDPPKHTYASILRASRVQSAPHLAVAPKMAPVVSEWHQVPQAIQQHVQPVVSYVTDKSGFETLDEVSTFDDEDSKSVYVGNIPASVSASDLEHEFRNFGRLKPDGVTIRSRKEGGFFYAFIEFEDTAGVQNALKASPVQLNGRFIHVESRRTNSGASRGGRRGRGRGGGYGLEASRGRFGGRSFVRADERSSTKGNGFVSRGAPRHEKWAQ